MLQISWNGRLVKRRLLKSFNTISNEDEVAAVKTDQNRVTESRMLELVKTDSS